MSTSNHDSSNVAPSHVQAAKASWVAPLVAIFINMALGKNADDRTTKLAIAVFAGLIILAGFVFAIWAIIGAFREGPKRILIPATIGLVINSFLVYMVYFTFTIAPKIIEQHRREEAAAVLTDWIPTGEDWHVDRKSFFAIQFPDDWEVIRDPQAGIAAIALSPLDSSEDQFQENITIVSGSIPAGMTREAVIAKDLRDLRRNTPGFLEYDSGTMAINGVDWSWIEFRQFAEGNELRVTGHMAVRHGRAYAVLCGGKPDRVADLKPVFDEVVSSLRVP